MTFAGTPNYDSLPVFASKKSKEATNPPGPDILHNLLDQVEDTAVGLVTMPWHVGKGLASDAKTLATGGSNYKTDDALKGILTTTWEDLKKRWTPLVEGDLPGFWDAIEEDPLGMILDVATVATAGAAGAGKAAQGAVAAGKGSQKAALGFGRTNAQLAGLRPTGKFLAEEAAQLAKSSGRGLAESEAAVRARTTTGGKHGVIAPDGEIFEPETATIRAGDGEVEISLARNPIVRARQRAGVAVSNQFPNAFAVGSNARFSRAKNREERRLTDREVGTKTRDNYLAEQALLKKEGPEALEGARAVSIAQRVGGLDVYLAQLRNTLKELEAKHGKAVDGDAGGVKRAKPGTGILAIRDRIDRLESPEVRRYAEMDPEDWSDEFAAYMGTSRDLSRDNTRQIWEMTGRPDPRTGEAAAEGADDAFEAYWDAVLRKEAEFALRDPEARAMVARGELSDQELIGSVIDESGELLDDVIDAEELAALMAGEMKMGDKAFVSPHTSRIGSPQAAGQGLPTKAKGEPAHTKKNTGYNFQHAFDLFTPQGIREVTRSIAEFNSSKRKMEALRQTARPFPEGGTPPKGWEYLDGEAVGQYTAALRQFVDEDMQITAGDSKLLDDARLLVDELESIAVADGVPMIVPTQVRKAFEVERKNTNRFLEAYDNLTAFWRGFTLSARPVWITGNYFGNLIFLLSTHGIAKGLAAYFQALRMGRSNALLDKIAPDVLSSSFTQVSAGEMMKRPGRESIAAATIDELESGAGAKMAKAKALGGKVAQAQYKMLEWNAILTDDAFRRAAFWAEIKPGVREIQKANPELTTQQAAELLLADPKLVDDVARKVMDDLVNFRDLTKMERDTIRRFYPFWSWIKGASGRALRQGMDEPWMAWAAMEGARWGTAQTEEEIGGSLPDYLQGMLSWGDKDADGNVRIVPTNALNPFATLGDVAGMVKSAALGDIQVGGNNPASAMNPFVKSPIEAFTNRDLFYGTPLDRTGRSSIGSRLGLQLYHSFPQTRYVEKALQDAGPLSGSTLYKPSGWDQLLSYMLIPTKQLNVAEADERARAQQTGLGANLI